MKLAKVTTLAAAMLVFGGLSAHAQSSQRGSSAKSTTLLTKSRQTEVKTAGLFSSRYRGRSYGYGTGYGSRYGSSRSYYPRSRHYGNSNRGGYGPGYNGRSYGNSGYRYGGYGYRNNGYGYGNSAYRSHSPYRRGY